MSQRALSQALGAAGLAVLIALSSSGQASAQSGTKTDWSQDKLEAYAAAVVDVEQIFAGYRPQIAEAESSEEVAALREEAAADAVEAVRDRGLSIEEYNRIYQATRADQRLNEDVQALIEDEMNN